MKKRVILYGTVTLVALVAGYITLRALGLYDEEYYYRRGNHKANNGDYQSAIEDMTTVLKINPDNNLAYATRAHARIMVGDNEGALEDYDRMIEIGEDAFTYFTRATLKRDLGQAESAMHDFNKSIALEPGFIFAHIERSLHLFFEGRYPEALEGLEVAVLNFSGQAPDLSSSTLQRFLSVRALVYSHLGMEEKAIQEGSRALAMQEPRPLAPRVLQH